MEYWDKIEDVSQDFFAAPVVGFDTEYHSPDGVDLRKYSPAHRAVVHVASVAWPHPSWELDPRGYPRVEAAVMSPGCMRQLEEVLQNKIVVAHNLSVDFHSAANSGVQLGETVNTLSLVRWLHPEWNQAAGGPGFSLDALGKAVLGSGKTISFKELTTCIKTELKTKKRKKCSCGKPKGCRKQGEEHQRFYVDEVVGTKDVQAEIPLQSIVPGHERWPSLLEYSAQDARMVLQLFYLLRGGTPRRSSKPTGRSSSWTRR